MKSLKLWLMLTIPILYGSHITANDFWNTETRTQQADEEAETNINEKSTNVIDRILEAYKVAIVASGNSKGQIKIDDIEKEFTLNFLKARFRATDGHLRNVLTVQRISPVSVVNDQDAQTISINSSIGFEYLNIEFDRFVIDMPVLKNLVAKIETQVKNCVFEVTVEVKPNPPCSAQLTGLQVVEFANFTPSVTGLRWKTLNTIAGRIVEAFSEEFSKSGKSFVENYFYENFKEAVELADVCSIMKE